MTVEDQRVEHNGMLEDVRIFLVFFYANDGIVGSRYSEWMQHSMNIHSEYLDPTMPSLA